VYTDRAEVTRFVSIDVTKPGIQDVVVTGFPSTINQNSLRVATITETSLFTILEVSYGTVPPQPPSQENAQKSTTEKKQLEEEAKILTQKIDEIEKEIERNQKELDWLKKYSQQFFTIISTTRRTISVQNFKS